MFVPTLVAFDCLTGIRKKTQVPLSTAHWTLYDSFLCLKIPRLPEGAPEATSGKEGGVLSCDSGSSSHHLYDLGKSLNL